MSDAPERIWIDEAGTVMHKGDSYVSIDGFTPIEYVHIDDFTALKQERNRLREAVRKYLPTVEAYRDAVTEYDPESTDRAAQLKRIDVAIGYERTANRKLRATLEGGEDE